jgi:hypothetical protein
MGDRLAAMLLAGADVDGLRLETERLAIVPELGGEYLRPQSRLRIGVERFKSVGRVLWRTASR